MTIRELMNRRKREINAAAATGLVLMLYAVGSFILLLGGDAWLQQLGGWSLLVGLAILVAIVLVAPWRLRCPACKGRLAYLVMAFGLPWKVSPRVRFCPYCGRGFDAP